MLQKGFFAHVISLVCGENNVPVAPCDVSMPNNLKLHLLLILTVHSRLCRLFHMNIIVRFLSINTRISEPCILLMLMPMLMSQL